MANTEPSLEEFERTLVTAVPALAGPLAAVVEEFINEGRVKGLAEGTALGQAKGKVDGILAVLSARGLAITDERRVRVLGSTHLPTLDRWLRTAAVCEEPGALFGALFTH